MLLRGQRAQRAKKQERAGGRTPLREPPSIHPSAIRRERRTKRRRGAAGSRCSPFTSPKSHTGHGPNRTGYLRLGARRQRGREGERIAGAQPSSASSSPV
ncbi:hypothetical protein ILYODFUR_003076 [Ilyodon furcidens]|uniref:Uncharacterized protein n=2 Tax=Goodeidae TaxID=28758 RepID=A0ABV0T4T6_9TELE